MFLVCVHAHNTAVEGLLGGKTDVSMFSTFGEVRIVQKFYIWTGLKNCFVCCKVHRNPRELCEQMYETKTPLRRV
jgi:hypothetical protein